MRNRPIQKEFNAVKASRRPPKFLCLLDRLSDSELTWYSPAAVCFCIAPQSCGTLLLHLHAAQRRRASELSEWRPGPATSWPGRVARRAPRRIIEARQCGNDRPGFGVHSVTQKLRAYNIIRVEIL